MTRPDPFLEKYGHPIAVAFLTVIVLLVFGILALIIF